MWLAAHQPNYLPYPGFFSKLLRSDGFLIANHLQFTSDQKRNLIDTHQGVKRLSLCVKSCKFRPTNEVRIVDGDIARKHWLLIEHSYRRSPFFELIGDGLHSIYRHVLDHSLMQDLCIGIIVYLTGLLGYTGKIHYGTEIDGQVAGKRKNEMIVSLCQQLGYEGYISGTGAKSYIDEQYFRLRGVKHIFNEYVPIRYPTFRNRPSVDNLSIIDVLFNMGPQKTREMLIK